MDAMRRLPVGDCHSKLLPYGAWGFRQRWVSILDELGLKRGHAHGLVPAGLRAGGVHRVCRLGEMQRPPLDWRQGGRPRLADWGLKDAA